MQRSAAGHVLIETLVASAIIVALAAGVAHVASMTSAAVLASGAQGKALFLAAQKIEQLRALTWTFDDAQLPVSDASTNLAFDPPTRDGAGLSASAPVTAPAAGAGYVDYLDRDGRWIGTGPEPPAATSFVRRWSVSPLAAPGGDALLLEVVVIATSVRGPAGSSGVGPNDPGVTWLATVRVRY